MYANKALKSSEGARQKATTDKSLQRKSSSVKFIKRALASQNNLLTGDAVQLRKMTENNSIINLVNTKSVQREEIPEDEDKILQGKFETIQRVDVPEEEEELPVQGKFEPVQMKKENNTGMPDGLKAGIESLSGMDMSDVRVHYNSDKPAGVGALAYTQGTDIHVASGQERHLAHEAWHVVQQAQGRVQPTMQLQGVQVNDDPGLEHEADVMGERAWRTE